MIFGYVGTPGCGKSDCMVEDARQGFREDFGQTYSNMASLRFPRAVYVDSEDTDQFAMIPRVDRGRVLIDEAGVQLAARFWQSVSRSVLASFAQSRHNGLDLYYTAQYEDQIDKGLRELGGDVIHCRRVARRFVLMTHKRLGSKRDVLRRRLRRFGPPSIVLYDTEEIIGEESLKRLGCCDLLADLRRKRGARGRKLLLGPAYYRDRALRAMVGSLWKPGTGESVRDYLIEAGDRPLGSETWVRLVMKEIARREWLADFGLTHNALPRGCTYDDPWLPGFSPREIRAAAAADRMVAEIELEIIERERSRLAAIVKEQNPQLVGRRRR